MPDPGLCALVRTRRAGAAGVRGRRRVQRVSGMPRNGGPAGRHVGRGMGVRRATACSGTGRSSAVRPCSDPPVAARPIRPRSGATTISASGSREPSFRSERPSIHSASAQGSDLVSCTGTPRVASASPRRLTCEPPLITTSGSAREAPGLHRRRPCRRHLRWRRATSSCRLRPCLRTETGTGPESFHPGGAER
jgi:hypothetical protein